MTRLRILLFLACAVVAGAFAGQIRDALAYPILDPGVGAVQGSGYPAFGADTTVTVTTTSQRLSLPAGLYAISCPVTVYADQSTTENVAAALTERRIPANYVYPLRTDGEYGTWVAFLATNATMSGAVCNVSRDGYR